MINHIGFHIYLYCEPNSQISEIFDSPFSLSLPLMAFFFSFSFFWFFGFLTVVVAVDAAVSLVLFSLNHFRWKIGKIMGCVQSA